MKINPTTSVANFKSIFRVPVETPKGSMKDIKLQTLGYNRPQVVEQDPQHAYFACKNEEDEKVRAEVKAKTGLSDSQIESKKLDRNLNAPNCPISPEMLHWSNMAYIWICSQGAEEITINHYRG